jgi:3-methylcrotonyl-CoA carboxylase alpha subunit
MNTRLQVEHPVTEMITGLDLVEWQLRVASGETLPQDQAEIAMRGHAVEVRLYAENPARNFLPATGVLRRLRAPEPGADLRIETGVREGDPVTMYYDPMIAKVVAWGEDRAAALRRLAAGLAQYRIAGLATNRDFLLRLLRHQSYKLADIDTGFIERHAATLLPPPGPAPRAALAAASLALLLDQAAAAGAGGGAADPYSPWRRRDFWRLNGATHRDMVWQDGGEERLVRARYDGGGYVLDIDGESSRVAATLADNGDLALDLEDMRVRLAVVRAGSEVTVTGDDGTWHLRYIDPLAPKAAEAVGSGRLSAPMTGKVAQVLATAGGRVRRGEALMIIEAMKMEHTIAAPADGVVERINFRPGDLVGEGVELIAFAAES